MPQKLIIVCFDINSEYEEDLEDKSVVNTLIDLESPSRIFDEYFETNLFLDSEKFQGKVETKYSLSSFPVSEKKSVSYEIYVFKDLSFVHNVSLSADSNIIFTNLENEKSLEKLERLFSYMKELYLLEIKTYVIGVFFNRILPNMKRKNMNEFFNRQSCNCEYFQVCCNPEYFRELRKIRNDLGDYYSDICEEENSNNNIYGNMSSAIDNILKNTFKEKDFIINTKKSKRNKDEDNSRSKCLIF